MVRVMRLLCCAHAQAPPRIPRGPMRTRGGQGLHCGGAVRAVASGRVVAGTDRGRCFSLSEIKEARFARAFEEAMAATTFDVGPERLPLVFLKAVD